MTNPTTIAPADMTQAARVNIVNTQAIAASNGASALQFFVTPCNLTIVRMRIFVTTTFAAAVTTTVGVAGAVSAFGTITSTATPAKGAVEDFTLSQVDITEGTVMVFNQSSRAGAGSYRIQIDWVARGSL